MRIEIINRSKHQLPQYSTAASVNMDLRVNLGNEILLHPMD
jgi:dUTP pyrophosphatase